MNSGQSGGVLVADPRYPLRREVGGDHKTGRFTVRMELDGEIARKRAEPSILADEYARMSAAARIGERSGLFVVPQVLRYDPESGVLETARVCDMKTIHQLAKEHHERLFKCLTEAGAALAEIHFHLKQLNRTEIKLAGFPGLAAENGVFLHGDFTGDNVGFSFSRQQLFIFDWSTARMLGRRGNFGSRYFDLVWFAGFLFQMAPVRGFLRWNSERMAEAFLAAYARHSSAFNRQAFAWLGLHLGPAMFAWWKQCLLARKYWPRRWGLLSDFAVFSSQRLMWARWQHFLKSRGS